MKILVAGATGAIGRPLIQQLVAQGHTVFGLVRSGDTRDKLLTSGAEPVTADALDTSAVRDVIARVQPHAIVNELTSLPVHYTPENMRAAAERDATVRLRGNENLLAGARETGVRRFIVQSSAFWYAPGTGLADEAQPFAFDASPAIAAGTRRYAELEAGVLGEAVPEGVALRYGFFYGPGTWYTREGDIGEQARRLQVPIIGKGQGVWSWVHIEDAAAATVAALECAPGEYNIVDNDPSEQRVWLSAFARMAGAPEPPKVTEEAAMQSAGPDAVYYATRLRGASNRKAKQALNFRPRPLEWLH